MDNAITQADLDAHPELVAAGLKVGDLPIPEDQLMDYTVTEFDTNYLALGIKVGDVIKLRKEGVVQVPEPKLEQYKVVLDAVTVDGVKTYLKDEVFEADSNDPVVQGLVAGGAIVLPSVEQPSKTDTSVQEDRADAVDTAIEADGEPRKRYRGHVVLVDGERTVEGHTYHNIKLDDGSEMDLNDLEYDTEVKVSYPPVK